MKQVKKIEDSTLWQEVASIAQQAYALIVELPEEEKMGMQFKFRQRAFDATDDIAEALGSIDPRDVKWYLSHARRDLFGIKNALSMAHKTRTLEAQPELMLQLDKAVGQLDDLVGEAEQAIPDWSAEMQAPEKGSKA